MFTELFLLENSLVVVDCKAYGAKILLCGRLIPVAIIPERRERAILEFVLEATRRHNDVHPSIIGRRLPVTIQLHVQLLPVEAEKATSFAKRLHAWLRAPLWFVELC